MSLYIDDVGRRYQRGYPRGIGDANSLNHKADSGGGFRDVERTGKGTVGRSDKLLDKVVVEGLHADKETIVVNATCHADGRRPRGTDGGGAERNVGIEDDVAEGRCQGADIVGTIEDMDTIGVGFGGGMSLADVGGVETSKDGVVVEARAA